MIFVQLREERAEVEVQGETNVECKNDNEKLVAGVVRDENKIQRAKKGIGSME